LVNRILDANLVCILLSQHSCVLPCGSTTFKKIQPCLKNGDDDVPSENVDKFTAVILVAGQAYFGRQ